MRNKRRARKAEAGKQKSREKQKAKKLGKQKSRGKRRSRDWQRNRKAEKQKIKETEKQRIRKAEKQRSRKAGKRRTAEKQASREKRRSQEAGKSREAGNQKSKNPKTENNSEKNSITQLSIDESSLSTAHCIAACSHTSLLNLAPHNFFYGRRLLIWNWHRGNLQESSWLKPNISAPNEKNAEPSQNVTNLELQSSTHTPPVLHDVEYVESSNESSALCWYFGTMSTCPINVECHLASSKISVFLCTSKLHHFGFSTNMGSYLWSLGTRETLGLCNWGSLIVAWLLLSKGNQCTSYVTKLRTICTICRTWVALYLWQYLMDTTALKLLRITLLQDAVSPSITKCHGLNQMCLCGITEVGQSLWINVLMWFVLEVCNFVQSCSCWDMCIFGDNMMLKSVRVFDIWRCNMAKFQFAPLQPFELL